MRIQSYSSSLNYARVAENEEIKITNRNLKLGLKMVMYVNML